MYSRVLQWPRMSLEESESELHCSQLGTPIDGECFLIDGAVYSPEEEEALGARNPTLQLCGGFRSDLLLWFVSSPRAHAGVW